MLIPSYRPSPHIDALYCISTQNVIILFLLTVFPLSLPGDQSFSISGLTLQHTLALLTPTRHHSGRDDCALSASRSGAVTPAPRSLTPAGTKNNITMYVLVRIISLCMYQLSAFFDTYLSSIILYPSLLSHSWLSLAINMYMYLQLL